MIERTFVPSTDCCLFESLQIAIATIVMTCAAVPTNKPTLRHLLFAEIPCAAQILAFYLFILFIFGMHMPNAIHFRRPKGQFKYHPDATICAVQLNRNNFGLVFIFFIHFISTFSLTANFCADKSAINDW